MPDVTKYFRQLIALAVTAAMGALTPHAHAAVTVRAGKAVAVAFPFATLDIGQKEGIFAKYGIHLDIISFRGDAKMQEGLASDSIDVGLGGGPAMAFAVKGSPVLAVAAFGGAPRDLAVLVKANSPIKTVADLRGKLIAVSTVGSLTDWLAHQIAVRQGWGVNGIKAVATGGGSAMISALITGAVDAGMGATQEGLVLEEKHEGKPLVTMAKFLPNFITHVIFARKQFIKEHPKTLDNFLKGFFATVAFMETHKAETVKDADAVLHSGPAVMNRVYDTEMPMFLKHGEFNAAALKTIKQSFLSMHILKKVPTDSQILTRQFLPVKF